MKAVIVKIDGKRAYALMEDGRFTVLRREPYMKCGMEIFIDRDIGKKLRSGMRFAACFAAFVFAVVYLAYCLYILIH